MLLVACHALELASLSMQTLEDLIHFILLDVSMVSVGCLGMDRAVLIVGWYQLSYNWGVSSCSITWVRRGSLTEGRLVVLRRDSSWVVGLESLLPLPFHVVSWLRLSWVCILLVWSLWKLIWCVEIHIAIKSVDKVEDIWSSTIGCQASVKVRILIAWEDIRVSSGHSEPFTVTFADRIRVYGILLWLHFNVSYHMFHRLVLNWLV